MEQSAPNLTVGAVCIHFQALVKMNQMFRLTAEATFKVHKVTSLSTTCLISNNNIVVG